MYVRRPRTKRPASARKAYKKRYSPRNSTLSKQIATIAKTVALRQQETKHCFTNLGTTPTALVHNTQIRISTPNIMYTTQGLTDGDSSGVVSARVGDTVTPVGVMIHLVIKNEIRYSGSLLRIIVLKTKGGYNHSVIPFKQITGQLIADKVDPENNTFQMPVYDKTFRIGSDALAARHDNTTTHNTTQTVVKKIWIPKAKLSQKYMYSADNSTFGAQYNLQCYAVAASSWDVPAFTEVMDIRFIQEFFFKDA